MSLTTPPPNSRRSSEMLYRILLSVCFLRRGMRNQIKINGSENLNLRKFTRFVCRHFLKRTINEVHNVFCSFFMLCSLASRFPCLVQEKTVCLLSSFVEKHWNYWWLGLYEDHSMDLMRIILSILIIWMTFEICCLLLGDKYSNNGILSYD